MAPPANDPTVPAPRPLPGRLYRDSVRQLLRNFQPEPGADVDAEFLRYLERSVAGAKDELRLLLARRLYSTEDLHCAREAVLVLSAGLVAHGRAEAIHDVLENALELYGEGKPAPPIRRIAWVIKALLPLPEGMDPESAPDWFRQWLRDHGMDLRWDAGRDRYVLRSGRELP